MRKSLLILSLAGLTVLASATDAFAQFRGFRGVGVYGPGVSIGVGGGGGYYSPYGYSGGWGYSPYYRSYGYAPSYYYAEPQYQAPTTQIRFSNYPPVGTAQQSASITVLVPNADAQVWFDDGATSQRGMERYFHTPPMEVNQNFTYTIKARWMANGKAVTRERQINVRAGQSMTVNFRDNTGETLLPPLPNTTSRK